MNEEIERIKNCCLEREDAFCSSACPFRLDVRELVGRIARGGFNSAYRMYSNAVGFPAIVSAICDEPCKTVCPRRGIDAAVSLRLLEAAATGFSSNHRPNSYSLPAKGKKIAVVGGGISGLAASLRLSNKKYDITVYEQSGRIGGHLWDIMDPALFLPEIETQFMYEKYDLLLSKAVHDLSPLAAEYDAVYVATGRGGDDFGLAASPPDGTPFASGARGVFLGGGVLGGGTMEAIAQGLRAAGIIEAYLKTGNMKSAPSHRQTRMILDKGAIRPIPLVVPGGGRDYSKEEAAEESGRCLRCRCDACQRHCALLRYFDKFPKKIEEEVHATIHPGSLDGNGTIATRFISTCNQCGLCAEVCPMGIDMGIFLRESHRVMREKGAMPWAFHEFWRRDMEHANSDAAALSARPEAPGRCEYVFFPGCQLGASDPRYVLESYEYLRKADGGTAVWVACCGAPSVWAGDTGVFRRYADTLKNEWEALGEPCVVLACPSCRSFFAEFFPEIKTRMLYDFFDTGPQVPQNDGEEKLVSVFDPCPSRHDAATQGKIRSLVESAGYRLSKLRYEKRTAQCCSWGGQIAVAAPNYTNWLVTERAKESDHPYVVYCSNCRDIFADCGKPVKHILDIVFRLGGWDRKPPTVSERRRNREWLKDGLISRYWPQRGDGKNKMCANLAKLLVSDELRVKINRSRLIEEDLLSVIEECENSGNVLVDAGNGHRTGYKVIGNLTHWVEYARRDGGYELFNAYSHRMKIEAGTRP
ncbi:MAG: NAD(P)-binding protein [Synergistaceae bacterium]|nr:NAD(P)-binding protein [Synergistaceae bacterium]